jgi:aryl-alcohol dehydrogenase-like predicted oxidoreductase
MKYRKLGNTGARVSALCLGAMTFGEADEKSFMHKVGSSEDESFRVLDRALELGYPDEFNQRIDGRW